MAADDRVVDAEEYAAAQKHARRVLDSALPDGEGSLEEFVSAYVALTRRGLSVPDALEVASGVARNSGAPLDPGAVSSLDEFLARVRSSPGAAESLIAGLNELYRDRSSDPGRVVVDGRVYERSPAVSRPCLVGLDDVLEEVVWSVEQLFFYDASSQQNPQADGMHPAILLHGPPGTGKSSVCRYALAEGSDLARSTGVRFSQEFFSASDYSKWVGESAQSVRRKYERVSDPSGVGVFVVDDVDMVLPARGAASSHGGLQVTGELMQCLSGVRDAYRGNVLVLATTNRPDLLDGALRRRFSLELEVPGYSSLGEYASFAERRLAWMSASEREAFARRGFAEGRSPASLDCLARSLTREHYGRPSRQDVLDYCCS